MSKITLKAHTKDFRHILQSISGFRNASKHFKVHRSQGIEATEKPEDDSYIMDDSNDLWLHVKPLPDKKFFIFSLHRRYEQDNEKTNPLMAAIKAEYELEEVPDQI